MFVKIFILILTNGSERLLRLPMYYDLNSENINKVINNIKEYFDEN